jgi:sodium/proline symporter
MEELATTEIVLDSTALASFVAYLVVVVAIGVYATRFASAGLGEFFVGGRKMNRFVVALSAVVSGRSAWLLLGVTGMAYQIGASAVWSVTGYIVAELLMFLYYAGRLRRFSEAYDCITIPDFFAARFNDTFGVLRIPLVAIILVFMVSYVAAQFVAGGKAFTASFGLSNTSGLLLTAAIVLIYTVLGGFLAVSLTDMLQALFMIVALVLLPLVAIVSRGGLKAVIDQLAALDPTMIDPFALSAGALVGFLGIGLGSPGNPHILVRYMSIRDPEQLRYSAVVGTVWNVVMAWGALFIGLVGRVYFPIPDLLPAGDAENLYVTLASQQLHPVLLGLVIASIFAAIMSTADSQLLVAASSIVRDLYQKVFRRGRELSPRRLVVYSRVAVILLVLLALLFGYLAHDLVFWLVLFAWAGLGAAIGPTSILALYWRRTTRAGVLAGLLAATTVTFYWRSDDRLNDSLYVLIPGFLAAFLATVVVSLITAPPDDADEMFDRMSDSGGETPRAE